MPYSHHETVIVVAYRTFWPVTVGRRTAGADLANSAVNRLSGDGSGTNGSLSTAPSAAAMVAVVLLLKHLLLLMVVEGQS